MHALALLYAVVLVAIVWSGVRSPYLSWPRALTAVFLIAWAIIIVTAHILSLFNALNATLAYVALSIGLAAFSSLAMRSLRPQRELAFPAFETALRPGAERLIIGFILASIALATLTNTMLVYGFLSANPDSIVYRFPRAYWYFGQGSLEHFTNHADPRPLYYPFNGTLAYLPLVHFQLGPRAFSLQSLGSWLMIGMTTYVFARDLGGSRVAAAATAWIIMLTPNVLIQATSTNDEIIAAAPMLGGLFFLHRWFAAREKFDLVLAALGVGISIGTKLHVMFFWPLLIAVAIALAFHFSAVIEEVRRWLDARSAAFLAALGILSAVLAASFIAYNYVSAGRASAWELNVQLLNSPFDLQAAVQTAVLYTAQIVLTPIADLHIALDPTDRAHHYAAFNEFLKPLFGWVDNGPAFTSVSYRFTGINSPSAVAFNEQTVFIGFTWLVILIAALWLAAHWRDPRWTWGRFHIAALPVWVLTFAASTRYIEGVTVYLGYAAVVAAPAMVYAFAPLRRLAFDRLRWFALVFVAATQCFFALNVFFTSSPRNLIVLKRATEWPVSRGFAVDPSVQAEIAQARNGVYSHTIAWGQPHWAFMAYHPEILQFLARVPTTVPAAAGEPDDEVSAALRRFSYSLTPDNASPQLHVYSFPQPPAYGHAVPLRIPGKRSPGLTLVGDVLFALGPEWVFMAGNEVDGRHPGRDRYVVIQFAELSDFGRNPEPVIQIQPTVYGLARGDNLSFRFETKVDGKLVDSTGWSRLPRADLRTPGRKGTNAVLTIHVRDDAAEGKVFSTDVVLGDTAPLRLAP